MFNWWRIIFCCFDSIFDSWSYFWSLAISSGLKINFSDCANWLGTICVLARVYAKVTLRDFPIFSWSDLDYSLESFLSFLWTFKIVLLVTGEAIYKFSAGLVNPLSNYSRYFYIDGTFRYPVLKTFYFSKSIFSALWMLALNIL